LLIVQLDNLLGLCGNVREFYCVYVLGPCLGAEHGQDARAASHVHDHLVLEQVRVFQNRVPVRVRAHPVLDHVLVDAEVRVRVEVLVRVFVLLDQTGVGPPLV